MLLIQVMSKIELIIHKMIKSISGTCVSFLKESNSLFQSRRKLCFVVDKLDDLFLCEDFRIYQHLHNIATLIDMSWISCRQFLLYNVSKTWKNRMRKGLSISLEKILHLCFTHFLIRPCIVNNILLLILPLMLLLLLFRWLLLLLVLVIILLIVIFIKCSRLSIRLVLSEFLLRFFLVLWGLVLILLKIKLLLES